MLKKKIGGNGLSIETCAACGYETCHVEEQEPGRFVCFSCCEA